MEFIELKLVPDKPNDLYVKMIPFFYSSGVDLRNVWKNFRDTCMKVYTLGKNIFIPVLDNFFCFKNHYIMSEICCQIWRSSAYIMANVVEFHTYCCRRSKDFLEFFVSQFEVTNKLVLCHFNVSNIAS